MVAPELVRGTSHGVTLLGDPHRPGGVTLAFTERTGGISNGCYASLNLGGACGDDPDAVRENRRRALAALGAAAYEDTYIEPKQVHGDVVVTVGGSGLASDEARRVAREGADAVVCVTKKVPVLMCFADCVPIILATEGGFAVVHSGWRGTIARIAGKALNVLVREAASHPEQVCAYVGPHIGVSDYEVSPELATRFAQEFGADVIVGERNLDLGKAVVAALVSEGLPAGNIALVEASTASNTDRFFSYRAQGGACGRHGALAWME